MGQIDLFNRDMRNHDQDRVGGGQNNPTRGIIKLKKAKAPAKPFTNEEEEPAGHQSNRH
jgi:hypothetical protein